MRIHFQNPTQGPLITTSFDDVGDASLAFVPAAMSSEPIAAVAGAASAAGGTPLTVPLAIAAMLPGDSPLRSTSFQGIQRFAPRASIDGVGVAHMPNPAPAVGLPEDYTTAQTVADAVAPIDWKQLAYADPYEFLRQIQTLLRQLRAEMIRRIQAGESPETIWQWLNDTLRHIETKDPIASIFLDEWLWDEITIFDSYPGLDKHELATKIRDTEFDWGILTSLPWGLYQGYINRWDALNRLQYPPSRPLTQLRP